MPLPRCCPPRTRAHVRLGLALLLGVLGCAADGLGGAGADEAPAASAVGPAPATPEQLEQAFVAAPADVVKGLAVADAWIDAGKRAQAQRFFKAHVAAHPGDHVAAFLLGRVDGGANGCQAMWAALLARLGLAEGRFEGLPEAWDALARVEEEEGRIDRAVLALERRVALAPSARVWTRLGWLRERRSDLAAAEQAYRQALKLDAEHGPARNALALTLARQPGTSREARKLAEESIAKDPTAPDGWIHLGLIKALSGDLPGATTAYAKAFEHAQGNAAALAALGSSYAELEQWELAEKSLAAALVLEPSHADALLQAAIVAVQREQWAEAKKLLLQAGKVSPKSAYVAFLTGLVAERTRQLESAVVAYRKAVAQAPENAGYALALAGVLIEKGSLEAASAVLTEAAERCPETDAIQLRLGFVAMQRKKWNAAVTAFQSAARLAPKDPDPHLYLAVLFGDHMDQLDQARLHLTRYRELGGKEGSALKWLAELDKAAN